MFKNISIKNYRGLSDVSVGPLSRINVFTGVNGSGKTSLLEAPFLLAGGPNAKLALSLYNFRSDSALAPLMDRPFTVLFPFLDTDETIEISCTIEKPGGEVSRTLRITRDWDDSGLVGAMESPLPVSGLIFEFDSESGSYTGRIFWESTTSSESPESEAATAIRLRTDIPQCPDVVPGHFSSPYYREIWMQSHQFITDLVKKNQVQEVVDRLQIIEPRLRNLVPLSERGVPVIYADIGADQLMPVSQLGGGFANILHLVLEATVLKRGVIMLDEVEDGLHFSIIKNLVSYICEIAVKNDIQFFISTHSDAVLAEFATYAEDSTNLDLSLFKLSGRNGKSKCHRFSSEDVISASKAGVELR